MSSGPARRVSARDIQVVQNLIERCLQLYMNQREVAETLLTQAKIEPGFTELVWQKLEEENQEFFKAYYLRLMLKHQIVNFNKLLKQQVQLMDQMDSVGAPTMSNSNGSHNASMHQNPVCCTSEDLHHPFDSLMTNAFANGIHTHQNVLSTLSSDMQGPNGGHFADASFCSVQLDSQSLNGGLQIPRCFNFSDSTADFAPSSDVLESYLRSTFLTSDNDFLDFQGRESQGDNKRLDTKSEGASYDDFGSK